MSFLLLTETLLEIVVIAVCAVLLGIIRYILSQGPLTKQSVKIKKYSGFVMLCVLTIGILDVGYTTYRLFVPANPYELFYIHKNTFGEDCPRVTK